MIAIDMEMPKKCAECRFNIGEIDTVFSREVMCAVDRQYHMKWKSRQETCPLIDLTQYEDDGK